MLSSAICESTGADIAEVSYVCGLDSRIGPKMLSASVGFGGSCLKKDILSLSYIAESLNLPEVASSLARRERHERVPKVQICKTYISLFIRLPTAKKKIAILGFAFKKDTGDTRESAAISLVRDLVGEGASISIYDPKALEEHIWLELEAVADAATMRERVTIVKSAPEAYIEASAVVIVTEWDEFSNKVAVADQGTKTNGQAMINGTASPKVNWAHAAKVMKKPMYVFDGRNVVDAGKLQALGFRVEGIGKSGTGRKIIMDFD